MGGLVGVAGSGVFTWSDVDVSIHGEVCGAAGQEGRIQRVSPTPYPPYSLRLLLPPPPRTPLPPISALNYHRRVTLLAVPPVPVALCPERAKRVVVGAKGKGRGWGKGGS